MLNDICCHVSGFLGDFSQVLYIEDKINLLPYTGIHLEKDMCVPSGHTVAKTMCLFEI